MSSEQSAGPLSLIIARNNFNRRTRWASGLQPGRDNAQLTYFYPVEQIYTSSYKASDVPGWNFGISLEGGMITGRIGITPTYAEEADTNDLAINLFGANSNLRLDAQLYSSFFDGQGDAQDLDGKQIGIGFMPSYQLLDQIKNSLNLKIYGCFDLSLIDYDNLDSQTRYSVGAGLSAGVKTQLGNIQFFYLFSHDRNGDGDQEVTGEEYINLHNLSVKYSLPMTKNLFFATGLHYLHIMDTPETMDEESSTYAHISLDYRGFTNYNIGLKAEKDIDGFEHQAYFINIGYLW